MTWSDLDPETIRKNLAAARERRDAAWAAFEAAVDELEWWKQGARIFGAIEPAEAQADRLLEDMFPTGIPRNPNLKQAVLLMMRADPMNSWTVDELVRMLTLNGWAPDSEPAKRVSDTAGVLEREKLVVRLNRGEYVLNPDLAGAMARRFAPVTNYARLPEGFPAPENQAVHWRLPVVGYAEGEET